MNGGFTHWRRSCPFLAGVLTTAAGLELVVAVGTAPGLLRFAGAGAPASWLLGGVLVVAGATLLFDPARRHFAGVTALVAGLLSLPGSNLGGFLLGFLLAVAGGALALAWVPDDATDRGLPEPGGTAPRGGRHRHATGDPETSAEGTA